MTLKGMTWDHPRGYDCMVATARAFAQMRPGVEIVWDKRSLQAFGDFPVEELAAQYDLMVIDHPHVGMAARAGCLVALDQVQVEMIDRVAPGAPGLSSSDPRRVALLESSGTPADSTGLPTLAAQSLGVCHQSYEYDGHQWALAIDAAAQVSAYRPDLIAAPPTRWSEVIQLAEREKVLWPIKPVDSLMSLFTLATNRGTACAQRADQLIGRDDGLAVLEAMAALARHVPRRCLSMNPIETFEEMSGGDTFCYCPLLFGYSNYARTGFRGSLVMSGNIPALGSAGPCGSCIGGTGIAVAANCKQIDIAVDYAFWIASADCQRGLYFDAGGQPANAVAWDDDRVNAASNNFFRRTRETLELGWLRPRYAGYLDFQDQGGTIVNAFLAGRLAAEQALDSLETAYRKSNEIRR